jgi:pullulanase/glycogen debranching enzyme
VDTLRSKSFDRNSYDSGDWFNRLDWSCQRQLLRHRAAALVATTAATGR